MLHAGINEIGGPIIMVVFDMFYLSLLPIFFHQMFKDNNKLTVTLVSIFLIALMPVRYQLNEIKLGGSADTISLTNFLKRGGYLNDYLRLSVFLSDNRFIYFC